MGQDKKAVFDTFRHVLTYFNKFEHVFSSSFRQGKIGQFCSVLKKCIKKEQKKHDGRLKTKEGGGGDNIGLVCLFIYLFVCLFAFAPKAII